MGSDPITCNSAPTWCIFGVYSAPLLPIPRPVMCDDRRHIQYTTERGGTFKTGLASYRHPLEFCERNPDGYDGDVQFEVVEPDGTLTTATIHSLRFPDGREWDEVNGWRDFSRDGRNVPETDESRQQSGDDVVEGAQFVLMETYGKWMWGLERGDEILATSGQVYREKIGAFRAAREVAAAAGDARLPQNPNSGSTA